jgi:Ca2+-binding EF-hand superfamily protein
MGSGKAGAQGLFFGFVTEQTPVIYNEHQVRDVTEHQAQDMFHAMDSNKNGFVSSGEFAAAYPDYFPDDPRGKLIGKRYRALDKKGSGSISAEEFVAYRNATIDDRYTMALTPNARQNDGDNDE